jgi:hypothetical protein
MIGDSIEERTNNLTFAKHFDGKRFYNPDALPARGFLDVLRWTLASRQRGDCRLRGDLY